MDTKTAQHVIKNDDGTEVPFMVAMSAELMKKGYVPTHAGLDGTDSWEKPSTHLAWPDTGAILGLLAFVAFCLFLIVK